MTFSDCSRKESSFENRDPKSVLNQNDLTILGLPPQVDSATVVHLIRSPDSIKASEPSGHYPFALSIWYYRGDYLFFNPMKRLHGVDIRHSEVMIAIGLQVGDLLSRVRELYGRSKDDYDLPYKGIALHFRENDQMRVFIQIDDSNKENKLVKEALGAGAESFQSLDVLERHLLLSFLSRIII